MSVVKSSKVKGVGRECPTHTGKGDSSSSPNDSQGESFG